MHAGRLYRRRRESLDKIKASGLLSNRRLASSDARCAALLSAFSSFLVHLFSLLFILAFCRAGPNRAFHASVFSACFSAFLSNLSRLWICWSISAFVSALALASAPCITRCSQMFLTTRASLFPSSLMFFRYGESGRCISGFFVGVILGK